MIFYIIVGILALVLIYITIKKPFWSVLVLLALIPFHAFLVNYLRFSLDLTWTERFIISLWKEWIILWLLVYGGLQMFREKRCTIKMYFFDWAIIILFLLSILSILWGEKDASTILFGLRFNFELFALYFAVRMLDLTLEKIKKLVYVILAAAGIVIVFGILQSTILPWDFLNNFGYTYAFEWLPGENAQSSQVVEGTRDFSRILSTLSGPNQLGSYLMVIGSILLSVVLFIKNNLLKIIAALSFVALLIPMYRSYSRSAWVGLLVAFLALVIFLIVMLLKKRPKQPTGIWTKLIIILVLAAAIVGGLFYFNSISSGLLSDVLLRPSSTFEHFDAYGQAFGLIKQSPFGRGVGVAGPASQWSLGLSRSIITESSYLQIGVELGILGMILFAIIIIGFIWRLFSQTIHLQEPLLKMLAFASTLGLIAVASGSFFLHTFTDSTTTFTLFALIGMIISPKADSEKKWFTK